MEDLDPGVGDLAALLQPEVGPRPRPVLVPIALVVEVLEAALPDPAWVRIRGGLGDHLVDHAAKSLRPRSTVRLPPVVARGVVRDVLVAVVVLLRRQRGSSVGWVAERVEEEAIAKADLRVGRGALQALLALRPRHAGEVDPANLVLLAEPRLGEHGRGEFAAEIRGRPFGSGHPIRRERRTVGGLAREQAGHAGVARRTLQREDRGRAERDGQRRPLLLVRRVGRAGAVSPSDLTAHRNNQDPVPAADVGRWRGGSAYVARCRYAASDARSVVTVRKPSRS